MSLLKLARYTQTYRKFSSKIRLQNEQQETRASTIRNVFLDYFVSGHNHRFIRSSPVTPFCDPTVPFVNAGMNQFKNVFLAKAAPPCERAANSQKCIRISGKHNDLDIIGTDGYHHTFFEMLGNWSFGDYYKEKACRMAWDLLTNAYKIDPRRLYVTYFSGDAALGLEPDYECREIWRSIGLPDNHILPFGAGDNFWEMGLTGPCGPCTEIHIDHLPSGTNRAQLVNAGVADLTELWNLVFIEYNRKVDGTLETLDKKYVDTGMGFERLVTVLQGKSSNYDTDLFTPIFSAIQKESKVAAYSGTYESSDPRYELDYAYRVIADHARMCSVCIADGMYPQTNNRLQKIVRRTLNLCESVFKSDKLIQRVIVPEIVNILGHVYPELEKKNDNIRETFNFEQEHYKSLQTRNRKEFHSLKISANSELCEDDTVDFAGFSTGFRDVEQLLKENPKLQSLPIDFLYDRLHSSLGLSPELIEKIAREKNLSVDLDDFVQHKQKKKLEAKMSHQRVNSSLLDSIDLANVPNTNFSSMYDYKFDSNSKQFKVNPIKATITLIRSDDHIYHIILDQTNFYHTAGGQDCDIGKLIDSNGNEFIVESVEKHKDHIIHSGHFNGDPFQPNQVVELHVDAANRTRLSQHHTAMHLLQAAIKRVTGQIIFQQSSHVGSTEMKCSLGSIGKRIDVDHVANVEQLIRKVIQEKVPIETHFLMAHDLYALDNVTTIPGEIYPDENIRVLKVNGELEDFISIEPCCGTHVRNTGELDAFCITAFRFNASNRSYDVTAIAGPLVADAKRNEQDFLSKFKIFKSRINESNSVDEWKNLDVEAIALSKELVEKRMPYLTKAQASNELDDIRKTIHIAQRAQLRKSVLSEMMTVLSKRIDNHEAFAIHVFNTDDGLEKTLIADAEQICHDMPLIILNVANGQIVHGKASVPLKYATEKFNAKHWLAVLGDALKIKCQTNKKKKQFAVSSFVEILDRKFSSDELQQAISKAEVAARQRFTESVAADQNNCELEEQNLIGRIDDLRCQLEKAKSIDDFVALESQSKVIRNHMKENLILYTVKSKCMTDLTNIDEQIYDARSSVEKELVTRALTDSRLEKVPFVTRIIKSDSMIGGNIMMFATDLWKEIPIVIVNISKDGVIGRASLPLSFTSDDIQAKDLATNVINQFDGKCIHHGTRYDASVCDFRLNPNLVNDQQLDTALRKINELIESLVNR